MTITTTFNPPLPSDSREVFDQKAFDTVSKFNPWSSEANQTAADINDMVTSPGVIAIGSDLTGANTIGTVAAVAADVSAVAAIDADVSAVAAIAADVSAVAANEANINAAVADLPALAAKVSKTGDTMTGPLEVPAGATGAQVPQAQEASPPGEIRWFARNTAPTGFLKANGAEVSRTTYAALFTAIGTTFGVGDGSTTFKLPDLRGEFPRGWDDGRGVDFGRAFGSAQGHMFQNHAHRVATEFSQAGVNADGSRYPGVNGVIISATEQLTTSPTSGTFGAETRPRNIALLACIKY